MMVVVGAAVMADSAVDLEEAMVEVVTEAAAVATKIIMVAEEDLAEDLEEATEAVVVEAMAVADTMVRD